MYPHHQETIHNVVERLRKSDEVLAVLLGGSIAHGFERTDSDVDIMIVVSEEDYRKRLQDGNLQYFETDSCTYEGGYIDGKYMSMDFLDKVAEKGSEPARFAFEGASVVFSRVEGVEEKLKEIARYPVEEKQERIRRFYAQIQAWYWYCGEALRHNNEYLLNTSISNLILFGGRLILAHNETLYPYHKWFLRVLEEVPNKPQNYIEMVNRVLKDRNHESIEAFFKSVMEFTDWQVSDSRWPNLFMTDSELNWLTGYTPVADL